MTVQMWSQMQELEPRLSLSVGTAGVSEGAGEFIVPPIRFELMTAGQNKFFPLEVGYKAVYEGVEDGEQLRLSIIVTRKTKVIDGVRTRVVIEKETADGELKEISRNYMAIEKRTHNVFYFGEDVDNYEDGEIVDHDGSWRAGVNGAQHGLIMPGNPVVGMRYQQERAPGIAEDRAEVISLNARLTVPAGTFSNVLKTKETNPLEPGDAEFKFYGEGVGLLKDGPAKLISVRRGSQSASAESQRARDGQRRERNEDNDIALYVSSGGTNSVLKYDGESGAFEGKFARRGGLIEPEGIAFGPDGNLYVSSRSDEVLRYDGESGKFIDVFASGHGLVDPAGIAFGGRGNDLFVASGLADDGSGNQILRFDGRTGTFEAVVDPGNKAGLDDPEAVVFGPDGLLYVSSTPEEGPGEVIRYNPRNNKFVDVFIPADKSEIVDPTGMVFGPDGDLFISSAATSEVKRYDGRTGRLEGVFVSAGSGGLNEAEGMAFGPNGNLFVASELGNAVLEYDGDTGAFVGEFVAADSGGLEDPTFIVFGPSED